MASVILVRRMVAPIRALRAGAEQLGSGALDYRIEDVRTGDELEALAAQFNTMASQLQDSYASLEEKVRQRTYELECANRALEDASLTDPLTGLRNRRFLSQNLTMNTTHAGRLYRDWLTRADGSDAPDADLTFLLIDLDHFKAVNDQYGHHAGDTVLEQLSLRLQSVCRETDYVVRWGGEEFLVVAQNGRRSEAAQLAERIRKTVAEQPFVLDDGSRLAKTCSIGYACYPLVPTHPELLSWHQIVELADRALYLSKKKGRNRCHGITELKGVASPVPAGQGMPEAGLTALLDGIRFESSAPD